MLVGEQTTNQHQINTDLIQQRTSQKKGSKLSWVEALGKLKEGVKPSVQEGSMETVLDVTVSVSVFDQEETCIFVV